VRTIRTRTRRIASLFAAGVLLLPGEDFNLKSLAGGHISVHTTLTYEGTGERLVATAKNDSGAAIQHANICVFSSAVTTGCLFENLEYDPMGTKYEA
jgi:hypothetical protein